MCTQVLVVEKLSLEKEFYFALVMDRAFKVHCMCYIWTLFQWDKK